MERPFGENLAHIRVRLRAIIVQVTTPPGLYHFGLWPFELTSKYSNSIVHAKQARPIPMG